LPAKAPGHAGSPDNTRDRLAEAAFHDLAPRNEHELLAVVDQGKKATRQREAPAVDAGDPVTVAEGPVLKPGFSGDRRCGARKLAAGKPVEQVLGKDEAVCLAPRETLAGEMFGPAIERLAHGLAEPLPASSDRFRPTSPRSSQVAPGAVTCLSSGRSDSTRTSTSSPFPARAHLQPLEVVAGDAPSAVRQMLEVVAPANRLQPPDMRLDDTVSTGGGRNAQLVAVMLGRVDACVRSRQLGNGAAGRVERCRLDGKDRVDRQIVEIRAHAKAHVVQTPIHSVEQQMGPLAGFVVALLDRLAGDGGGCVVDRVVRRRPRFASACYGAMHGLDDDALATRSASSRSLA
jgi:hypothetical protein